MPTPALVPVPPTRGSELPLIRSPIWIGSDPAASILIDLPGIAARQVTLVEREDGWWALRGDGAASVNGARLGSVKLSDGDVLEVAPGWTFEFVTGVARPLPPPPEPAVPVQMAKPRQAKRAGPRLPRWLLPSLVVLLLLGGAGYAIYFALFRAEREGNQLTAEQAVEFSQLLDQAYEHIERGSALLEAGLPNVALEEFAKGINVLELSGLRDNAFVRPRIEALKASVAAVYRQRSASVPRAYANAASTTLLPMSNVAGALPIERFAAAFEQVQAAFSQRFKSTLVVTGADHAEHVSLYGRGGAMDLRTKTLTAEQVAFVIATCRQQGIRVKDFSQDSVLQAQIRAARAAGLDDRAGTGNHLHIDRFPNRRDRWTVGGSTN